MAVRQILMFPDPALGSPCHHVTHFNADLKALATDLLDTMHAAPGVGITAAHIGVPLRLVVLELSSKAGACFYANPEIMHYSDERIRHVEGSVSMPGATEEVERPRSIRFRYQDLDGNPHEEDADGFNAVCMQHEVDQLDGIFWIRRLSRLKRERLVRRWEKGR